MVQLQVLASCGRLGTHICVPALCHSTREPRVKTQKGLWLAQTGIDIIPKMIRGNNHWDIMQTLINGIWGKTRGPSRRPLGGKTKMNFCFIRHQRFCPVEPHGTKPIGIMLQ